MNDPKTYFTTTAKQFIEQERIAIEDCQKMVETVKAKAEETGATVEIIQDEILVTPNPNRPGTEWNDFVNSLWKRHNE